jgi:hypothetical protein
VNGREIADALKDAGPDPARLERILGAGGKRIGSGARPGEYAFLCADYAGGRRAAIVLELVGQRVLVAFDLGGKLALEYPALAVSRCGETMLVARPAGTPAPEIEEAVSVELTGLRIAGRVALLHSEARTWRSPVSYHVRGEGQLKHLVLGLAPGAWELWRDGWLIDPDAAVPPDTRALAFERPAGGFFLRRFG